RVEVVELLELHLEADHLAREGLLEKHHSLLVAALPKAEEDQVPPPHGLAGALVIDRIGHLLAAEAHRGHQLHHVIALRSALGVPEVAVEGLALTGEDRIPEEAQLRKALLRR